MARPKKSKPVGDIEVASKNPDGSLKPSVYFLGDANSWWVYHLEGIEGLHEPASTKITEESTSKKPRAIYLNHGYFKLKPAFKVMVYEGTSDPMPRIRNGHYSGVYEAYDVQNKKPCVIWCYTAPNDLTTWERLQQQIEYAINRMEKEGVATVDADGYLPAIWKIGKLPTKMGAKYAKVVGWDAQVPIPSAIDSPEAVQAYKSAPSPMFPNQFENRNGPVGIPDVLLTEQGSSA
jgi:hypothetical protein